MVFQIGVPADEPETFPESQGRGCGHITRDKNEREEKT